LEGEYSGREKSLSFRRCRIRNVDDMVEGCITLHKESRIDQRLHWYDHFFNSRLKRMHDNRDRGHITLDNGGEVRRGLQRHYHHVNQRRNRVWGNHRCLRI
jgi:hypothetical protein